MMYLAVTDAPSNPRSVVLQSRLTKLRAAPRNPESAARGESPHASAFGTQNAMFKSPNLVRTSVKKATDAEKALNNLDNAVIVLDLIDYRLLLRSEIDL